MIAATNSRKTGDSYCSSMHKQLDGVQNMAQQLQASERKLENSVAPTTASQLVAHRNFTAASPPLCRLHALAVSYSLRQDMMWKMLFIQLRFTLLLAYHFLTLALPTSVSYSILYIFFLHSLNVLHCGLNIVEFYLNFSVDNCICMCERHKSATTYITKHVCCNEGGKNVKSNFCGVCKYLYMR